MLARRTFSVVAGIIICVVGSAFALWTPTGAFAQGAPSIEEQSVLDVSAESATLSARIDAHELETEYSFQYGPTSTYGQTAPAPAGSVGAEFAGGEVTAHVQGLQAHTTYHFRVVVHNSLGTVEGGDQTFKTQGVAGGSALLDGRQWEMVSPLQKHGAAIFPLGSGEGLGGGTDIQAAADGNAFTYLTSAPTEASPQGYALEEQVLSTRGSTGWESHDISSPRAEAVGLIYQSEYQLFSSDLSQSVLQPFGNFEPALSPEASEQTAFLRNNYPSGDVNDRCTAACLHPLVTGKQGYANVPPGTAFGKYFGETEYFCSPGTNCGPQFVDATPDLKHIVLHSEVPLTSTPPAEAPEGENSYMYEWSEGKLVAVGVLPDGEVANQAQLGGVLNRNERHAISADGSRVIWHQPEGRPEAGVYLRDTKKGETIKLASEEGAFQIASADGSKVFFTTGQQLTPNSGAQPRKPDLYECEVIEEPALHCKLSDLTPPSASAEPADVQGYVTGASEDGSYIYFVANGVLAAGAVQGKCQEYFSGAEGGAECNLYVNHDGVTKLIAVLMNFDTYDWDKGTGEKLTTLTASVSPNGRWLAFMSAGELTGYDNRDALTGERDVEVYLYDAESGHLVCASCDPTGARPIGVKLHVGLTNRNDGGQAWSGYSLAADIQGATNVGLIHFHFGHAIYQSRFLSDSGRLFFNSDSTLVPQDVNGTWDVYEYEPPGVGSCSVASAAFSERSDGCVGLVSSGTSLEESAFMDASKNGSDVFFLTLSQLSVQDTDNSLDVYDAHECSQLAPCFPVPATQPPPCSTGDACKAAPTPQPPVFGAPASATLSGGGDVAPASEGGVESGHVKSSTRARGLARALRVCGRMPKRQRPGCRRQARRRYAKQSRKAGVRNGGRG